MFYFIHCSQLPFSQGDRCVSLIFSDTSVAPLKDWVRTLYSVWRALSQHFFSENPNTLSKKEKVFSSFQGSSTSLPCKELRISTWILKSREASVRSVRVGVFSSPKERWEPPGFGPGECLTLSNLPSVVPKMGWLTISKSQETCQLCLSKSFSGQIQMLNHDHGVYPRPCLPLFFSRSVSCKAWTTMSPWHHDIPYGKIHHWQNHTWSCEVRWSVAVNARKSKGFWQERGGISWLLSNYLW